MPSSDPFHRARAPRGGRLARILRSGFAATALTLVALPLTDSGLHAQDVGAAASAQAVAVPEVVSRMVSVGPDEARLTLELSSGSTVALTLSGGEIRMGEEVMGSYTPGDALDRSWRELVAASLALDEEALLEALVDWTPPSGLSGSEAEAAQRMDEFLAASFDTAAIRAAAVEAQEETRTLTGQLNALESLELLSRIDLLAGLSETLSRLDTDNLRIVVDDHLEVESGEVIDGSVLVVDGSIEVRGTVRGDVIVVDGDVDLYRGGRITGGLTLTDADLDDDGGQIDGGVFNQTPDRSTLEEEIRAQVLAEISDGDRGRARDNGGAGFFAPFFRILGGVGDIIGMVFKILLLGGVGVLLLNTAGNQMETVAETARYETGRAAVVGLAGAALFFPIWILGIVGLAITIIGIPAILLWLPLFPAAVGLAALAGYLAVARNMGIWLSRQGWAWADWVRVTSPGSLVFGGVILLFMPYLAGELLDMVGFLGFFAGLLKLSGLLIGFFATAVGFGSVIITRGGHRTEDWGSDMFTRPFRNTRWGRARGWGDTEVDLDAEMSANRAAEASESWEAGDTSSQGENANEGTHQQGEAHDGEAHGGDTQDHQQDHGGEGQDHDAGSEGERRDDHQDR